VYGWPWFLAEFDEDSDVVAPDAVRAFHLALRERAGSWPCEPTHTEFVSPSPPGRDWCAVLDVISPARSITEITVGVCFDGSRIRASEVHNQNYHPLSARQSRVEIMEATGTPEELAGIAADWFEALMARYHPETQARRQ
jgi:hypothetical protein